VGWLRRQRDAKLAAREDFWALKDVSFEIQQGEVVGVIGRNGAGKSTLLKILSRITEPTIGRIRIKGRVASLLEVGTGFHQELTGRENIFLNGAILGMTKAEIKRKFDEIVAFSEVERFLDTPVKRYSSGMYVRLAFAVAAHLEPEILIVDEVLAVGDASFQKKCLGKMQDVSMRQGRTVLFVSHNMVAVQSLCRKALLLVDGQLVETGPTSTIVTRYLQEKREVVQNDGWTNPQAAPGSDCIRIKAVKVEANEGNHNGLLTMQCSLRIETEYWVVKEGVTTHITYHLVNEQAIVVLTSGSTPAVHSVGLYKTVCHIPANLLNSGAFFVKLLLVHDENQVVYQNDNIASFTLVDATKREYAHMNREPGVIQPLLQWNTSKMNI
jgi:lipopolysaccharide transport system ATP-binding protein